MRALIFELRPDSLEAEGLVAALMKQTQALRARHGIEVQVDFCDEPSMSIRVREALYRIAQEALHNIVKHARASRVDLDLICGEAAIVLQVKDNGLGFDTSRPFPGHLGLRSMRERAERVGGTFELESTPGRGTLIQVRIPKCAD
jgi:signal transduction histidine kinase